MSAADDVDLGRWTVDELRASGFDETGVVQPLLRPAAEPVPDVEAVRRDLEARGALVREGDRWTPRGDLGVVLVTRARSRLVVSVRGRRTLLLGLFAPGGALLQVDEDDAGTCACRLRTRADVLADLLGGVLDAVPDVPPEEQPEPETAQVLLVLESLRADDPGSPPVQVQLTVLGAADGARIAHGRRVGEQGDLDVRRASHAEVRAAVDALLAGRAA